ncbi:response regulator transcription factor [Flavivirga abyssicola]|uniref:response regulator transcription factor n=1 Tax=Flavivirga abyssicola TaxID=3063533 RepID=UPI0026E0B675|nr:response regulator transcription factor [Flavivirga sp. MEBiC07777]WVK15140.1 response regulator transcription factor [Flavivirga sp. MEBiC07777]
MTKTVDILIVDDSLIFSQALSSLLKQYPNQVNSVQIVHNYQEALSILSMSKINTLILDLNFESQEYTGFDIAKKVKEFYPEIKIIILTQQAKIDNYETLFNDINVDGYLDKRVGIEEALEALSSVTKGEKYIDRNIKAMLEIGKWLDISKREREIADLLSQGLTQKEIAKQLFISNRTVESHIKNLTKKIGAKNTAHLVTIYTKYINGNREGYI